MNCCNSEVFCFLYDNISKMDYDDEISALYRVLGIRSIGVPNVFPKTRIVKKVKKSTAAEKKSKPAREEGKGIDIEV